MIQLHISKKSNSSLQSKILKSQKLLFTFDSQITPETESRILKSEETKTGCPVPE